MKQANPLFGRKVTPEGDVLPITPFVRWEWLPFHDTWAWIVRDPYSGKPFDIWPLAGRRSPKLDGDYWIEPPPPEMREPPPAKGRRSKLKNF